MKNQESLNIDTENKQSIDNNKYCKLKKSVKKIKNTDNFGLIRAVVIGIAYTELDPKRHHMLQRTTNRRLLNRVYQAAYQCNLLNKKCKINDLKILERYFEKYRIILLDNNYKLNRKLIYYNDDVNFKKNIYLQYTDKQINVIDSMPAYLNSS